MRAVAVAAAILGLVGCAWGIALLVKAGTGGTESTAGPVAVGVLLLLFGVAFVAAGVALYRR